MHISLSVARSYPDRVKRSFAKLSAFRNETLESIATSWGFPHLDLCRGRSWYTKEPLMLRLGANFKLMTSRYEWEKNQHKKRQQTYKLPVLNYYRILANSLNKIVTTTPKWCQNLLTTLSDERFISTKYKMNFVTNI